MRKPGDELLLKALAAEIKGRRAVLELSQDELAHRAGLNRSFVAKIELNQTQPSLTVLFHIAEALSTTATELVAAVSLRVKRLRSAGIHRTRRDS